MHCRRISPSYWQVVFIAMVGPFAGTFWDTSALATCTRNFPAERGTVIGIVKACMGTALTAATRPHADCCTASGWAQGSQAAMCRWQDGWQGLAVAVIEGWRGGAGEACIIWPHTLDCRQPWRGAAPHTPAAVELGATQAHWTSLAGSSRSPSTGLIDVRPCDWD